VGDELEVEWEWEEATKTKKVVYKWFRATIVKVRGPSQPLNQLLGPPQESSVHSVSTSYACRQPPYVSVTGRVSREHVRDFSLTLGWRVVERLSYSTRRCESG